MKVYKNQYVEKKLIIFCKASFMSTPKSTFHCNNNFLFRGGSFTATLQR